MISWAVENEYLDANPIDGMTKPAEETSRDRVLNDDEDPHTVGGIAKGVAAVSTMPAHYQALFGHGAARR